MLRSLRTDFFVLVCCFDGAMASAGDQGNNRSRGRHGATDSSGDQDDNEHRLMEANRGMFIRSREMADQSDLLVGGDGVAVGTYVGRHDYIWDRSLGRSVWFTQQTFSSGGLSLLGGVAMWWRGLKQSGRNTRCRTQRDRPRDNR